MEYALVSLGRWRRYTAAGMVFLLGCLGAGAARANDAAGLLAALRQTLRNPDVYLRSTTPFSSAITTNNRVLDVHSGTADAQRSLCRWIESAKQEVLITAYEWNDHDEAATMVIEAIQRRIRRAVDERQEEPLIVRIVVNDTKPSHKPLQMARLRQVFAQLRAEDPDGDYAWLELVRYTGFGFSVMHARYAVIDSRVAILRTNNFLGQNGIEEDFFNCSVEVQGPVVRSVRDDWLSLRLVSTLVDDASHRPGAWLEPLEDDDVAPSLGGSPMAVLTKTSRFNPWTEGPTNPQNAGLLTLIRHSEQEILSLSPALNVRAIKRALEDAIVRRGVEVTLILSLNMNRQVQRWLHGGDNADSIFEMLNNLLARGGVECADKLHVYWASNDQTTPARKSAAGNNHAKTALYDGQAMWLGSMNWDWQSWNNSRELNLVVFDSKLGSVWRETLWQPTLDKAVALSREDLSPCLGSHAKDSPACTYLPERSALARADGQTAARDAGAVDGD